MKQNLAPVVGVVLAVVLVAVGLVRAQSAPEPSLPHDNPQLRDLIECRQAPGRREVRRYTSDGEVLVTDGGVLVFTHIDQFGNHVETALVNMACRVTYDVGGPVRDEIAWDAGVDLE